jgi:AraC-like DNA-binding protein
MANLDNERFGVSELAREMKMSRSNLHRKIKAHSGDSVSVYLRKIRLNKAREILEEGSISISEVSYQVGFGSPGYFRKCFHHQFGILPSEYRNKPETIFPNGVHETHHSIGLSKRKRALRSYAILGS